MEGAVQEQYAKFLNSINVEKWKDQNSNSKQSS